MNRVLVISLDKKFSRFKKEIKNTAFKILAVLNKNNVLVEIYLINSLKMRFLNKKFRGQDKTTTVLSFTEPRNFIYPPERGTTQTVRGQTRKIRRIGEIYLNAEVYRKSQRHSASSQRQLAYFLTHGLLHLCGYNHSKKSDRIKMERAEQRLLRKLQIPSTKFQIIFKF
jgi:probable rRNA maturation factor